jgi:hypothetical protein
MSKYRIVIASHKPEVLKKNVVPSKLFDETPAADISIMRNYSNIPKAYNTAKRGELITIYMHHDVFLPDEFQDQLEKSIKVLPENWGVLGVAGATIVGRRKRELLGHVLDRGSRWGHPFDHPQQVETLDELILIVNTQIQVGFDEQFSMDFYGADICIQAMKLGYKNYVIPAYCHHNSERVVGSAKPATFYESERKFKLKWRSSLPLSTTCSIMV